VRDVASGTLQDQKTREVALGRRLLSNQFWRQRIVEIDGAHDPF